MLSDIQLDTLREVTSIGCGAAATALSAILNSGPVTLDVTKSSLLSRDSIAQLLGGQETLRATVYLTLYGGFDGTLLISYTERAACDLTRLLTGCSFEDSFERLDPLSKSALMEVGNIVGSAFLTAVGQISGLVLMPSVPTLVIDKVERIVESIGSIESNPLPSSDDPEKRHLVLETLLIAESSSSIRGHLVLLPEIEAIQGFLEALKTNH